MIVTDDVYRTFVPGSRSIAAAADDGLPTLVTVQGSGNGDTVLVGSPDEDAEEWKSSKA